MTILIVNRPNLELEIFALDKAVTTLGANNGFDIVISGLPAFSLIKEKNAFHLMSLSANPKDSAPKLIQKEKSLYQFQYKDINFLIFPESKMSSQSSIPEDWDFQKFPKDPLALDYPEKILCFILDTFKQSQGALFFLDGAGLHTLYVSAT